MVGSLQIGLLNYFSIVFPALLVFFVVFAILEKTEILGQKKTVVNAIVGIALAFILILSRDIVTIINYMIPWFVILFVFLILLLIIFKVMGASDEDLSRGFMKGKTLQYIFVGIGIIILIASIAHVYGDRLLPVTTDGEISEASSIEGSSDFKQNVFQVIFNPLILGTLFILVLAVFAIALITKEKI